MAPGPSTYFRNWPLGSADRHPDASPIERRAAELVAHVAHQLANARTSDRFRTQKALSLETGLSRFTLSRIEAGSHWPDISSVMKVCAALGLRVELVDDATGQAVVIHNPPKG